MDANGNGVLDIVAFGQTGVFVSFGKADGTFSPGQPIPDNLFTNSSAEWTIRGNSRTLGDLTGDGKPDIIGFATRGVHVTLNNADGTFRSPKLGLDHFGTASLHVASTIGTCSQMSTQTG